MDQWCRSPSSDVSPDRKRSPDDTNTNKRFRAVAILYYSSRAFHVIICVIKHEELLLHREAMCYVRCKCHYVLHDISGYGDAQVTLNIAWPYDRAFTVDPSVHAYLQFYARGLAWDVPIQLAVMLTVCVCMSCFCDTDPKNNSVRGFDQGYLHGQL